MSMPQKEYYNPDTEIDGRMGEGLVLKPRPFKPLKNIKTGNFFSYSFATAERNNSINNDPDIIWVHNAPPEMQDKIDTLNQMHQHVKSLHDELVQCMKDEDKPGIRRAEKTIIDFNLEIDEFIYPESEREYVESLEAKRVRLEQQNELTLDAASIAALREPLAPMGSTADASLAQAKLEIALQKIADLEADAKLTDKDAPEPARQPVPERKPAPARPQAARPEAPPVTSK